MRWQEGLIVFISYRISSEGFVPRISDELRPTRSTSHGISATEVHKNDRAGMTVIEPITVICLFAAVSPRFLLLRLY